MNTYKLGSLFDGSGGFPLAGSLCGITPVWAAEVEPYPIAVTKSRFPSMKHLGDISKVNGAEIEPVDIITFGSPCQDLSVAGKRAGLKHEANGDEETTRSGLFMEAVRIIKEMREATNGKYPRFALWENVPGAFSSNKGEDFRIVLEELVKIVEPSAVMPAVPKNGWSYADSYCGNGWSLAYRVFDAQYWGVPQRRRRIYLVADFAGECAREVLFEREGLRGYFAEGRTPWQGTTADAENGVGADDREGKCYGIDHAITTGGNCTAQGPCVYEDIQATLKASGPHAVCYSIDKAITTGGNCTAGGDCVYEDISQTLCTDRPHAVCYVMPPVGLDGYNSTTTGDKSSTLGVNCGMSTGRNGVIEPIAVATQQGGAEISKNGVCPTITAAAGMSGNNQPWICKEEPMAAFSADADSLRCGDKCRCLVGDHNNRITDMTALVCEPVACIDGDKIGKAERAGGSGLGVREGNKMYTLTAKDAGTHGVAYANVLTITAIGSSAFQTWVSAQAVDLSKHNYLKLGNDGVWTNERLVEDGK